MADTGNFENHGFHKPMDGKRRWRLVPFDMMDEVIAVFEWGAEDRGRDNWKECNDPDTYWEAAQRHISAYASGETNDIITGRHHLAHVVCCCLFQMWLDKFKFKRTT